jgi:GNAT superfamily N-acetyltransferase
MILIREAAKEDNNGLLTLTALTPMEGRISLLIDRQPDFFSLFHLRGPGKIFIAEKDNIIAGSFSLSIIDMLICGKTVKVYYLGDLKILPDYAGKTIAVRLLHHMYDYLLSIGAGLLFSTAAYGNTRVLPLFDGRTGLPTCRCIGAFNIYQIIPVKRKIKQRSFLIKEMITNPELTEFYSRFYKNAYRFAPIVDEQYLKGSVNLVAMEDGIKASLSLIDVGHYKQNVLIRLPFTLRILLGLLHQLNRVLRLFNIPVIGKPIKILYIKAFGFSEGNEHLLRALIQHARNSCLARNYCFLSVAVHEKDPMTEIFRKYLHFNFKSLGYLTDISKNTDNTSGITDGPIFEDYSVV